MSGLAAASTDVASKPFWNASTQAMSCKLWCPMTSSPTRTHPPGSWFSIKTTTKEEENEPPNIEDFLETCSRLLWQRIEELERDSPNPKKKQAATKKRKVKRTEKRPAEKARKIRVYPNAKEREILNKWFGAVRWTYNQCLDGIQQKGLKRDKKTLRSHYLNSEAIAEHPEWDWLKEIPYDIRDEGMNDLLKAYNSCFAKGDPFQLKFRSKKRCVSESLVIHQKHWKKKKGAYAFLRNIKSSESLPEDLEYDSRFVRTKDGRYYLCIPIPLSLKLEKQEQKEQRKGNVVAIDPGVRCFATCYDPAGKVTQWGEKDIARICRLGHALDDLQSRWSDKALNSHKRWSMRRAASRIRHKVKNLVADLHRKLAKWLCQHYEFILLPTFQTQKMVKRGISRRIGSKTARSMLTWSHYLFKMRLANKAREYPGCKVIEVNEAYTSKTCGRCGRLNQRLGGSKLFVCPHPPCDFRCDRDHNGARNILLRFLTESTESLDS